MSSKKKVLLIQNIHEAGINLLKDNPSYEFEIFNEINDEVKNKITDCDAISIRTAKLPNEIIRTAKNLKVISSLGLVMTMLD